MIASNLNATVGQLVAERPGRARVFERFGIDYCCGGRMPLARAIAAKGLKPETVLGALDAAEIRAPDSETDDWSPANPGELVDFIVATHHAYLRRELPRLDSLLAKVNHAHGGHHPELAELREVFAALRTDLEAHMLKEEWVVFPWIASLNSARDPGLGLAIVIEHLERDHEDTGSALARMRALTDDYTPPADACPTYRALLEGLAELEADMHQHVHRENNLLFEQALSPGAAPGVAGV